MVKKITSWWGAHRPTKRRLIQLYSALLYNAHLKGFVTGSIYKGNTKALCVPGLNCYSCPGAVGACPLGSMQAALASSGEHIGFYMIGIILLYGLIFGRTVCGFLCPMGLLQELLHRIPTPKIQKNRITAKLTYLKYVILAVFAVIIPLWYGLRASMAVPGFCKYICPAGTFEGAIGLLSNNKNASLFGLLGICFTRKFVIMLLIGLLCIFCYRAFCRFLCPLGALYGMFSRLSLIGIKVDELSCNGCGLCVRKCKMDVRQPGDHECIHCAKCVAACPQSAISLKAGNHTLKPSKMELENESLYNKNRRKEIEKTIWIAAGAVLVIALLICNLTGSSKKDNTGKIENRPRHDTEKTLPEVSGVGEENSEEYGEENSEENTEENTEDRLEQFTAACLDGTTFDLYENRGKVVVINLWATYCGPCVKEMPYFNELYHEHEGDIAMLAVHAAGTDEEEVREFLDGKGWDIPFTVDDDDETIFGTVGGSDTLPQTIVLNRRGEVIYNKVGSVSAELLEKLYEEAAGDGTAAAEKTEGTEVIEETPDTKDTAEIEGNSDTKDTAETEETSDIEDTAEDDPDMLNEFSVACLDGSVFDLKAQRGKKVILAFWGTYSEESIECMDVLEKFHEDEPDVPVIAICSYYTTADPQEIAAEHGWSFQLASDDSEESLFELAGASMAVPRFVIVDEKGNVIYNIRGSLTEEEIKNEL